MAQQLGTRPQTSPAWIVNAAVVTALVLSMLLIGAAEQLPAPALGFRVEGDRIVTTAGVLDEIRERAGAAPFRLAATDLIEEPDVLGSWQELNDFYTRQGEVWKRLGGPTLEARIAGVWRTVEIRKRSLLALPLAFYTQLIASFVVWIAGFVTYAFSDRGLAARIYAISAVAFCTAVWPAALYSTRPLAIEPGTFRLLSTVDHAGGLLFAAGLVGLLAVYPVRLIKHVSWIWVMGAVATVAGHYQVADMSIAGFYTTNAVQFVMFLVFAGWQWRASRPNPIHRAALGWMLLSMFVGIIFFFTFITVPVLIGGRPNITQTTGFVCIVLLYVGISLGVLRFRLFELDRWWFRTWSWILSGIVVVGADLLLTRLFALEHEVALIVTLIVVGWVYFPIRQRLLERFGLIGQKVGNYDRRELITATTPDELLARFQDALRSNFNPLELVYSSETLEAPRLSGEGAWLEVPSPLGGGQLRCHFRESGARLFSRDDVARARDLLTLCQSVRSAIEARVEGEIAERTRIRRDLHDDLGASIIRIAHQASDERTAALAKTAMRDLRDVLAALEEAPSASLEVLDDLEADLRARAHAEGRDFEWIVQGEVKTMLSARSRANLTRALRESMTNALRHGSGKISYQFEAGDEGLRAIVENGASSDGPIETGMGIGNITSRMRELGGNADFSRNGGSFRLALSLPWSKEP